MVVNMGWDGSLLCPGRNLRGVGEGEVEPVVFLRAGFGDDEDEGGGVKYDDDGGSEAECVACGGDEMARWDLVSDTDRCSGLSFGWTTRLMVEALRTWLVMLAGGEGGGGPTSVSI